MTCQTFNHVFRWDSTISTQDPPPGLACQCGAYEVLPDQTDWRPSFVEQVNGRPVRIRRREP